jgi:hypothetical protein
MLDELRLRVRLGTVASHQGDRRKKEQHLIASNRMFTSVNRTTATKANVDKSTSMAQNNHMMVTCCIRNFRVTKGSPGPLRLSVFLTHRKHTMRPTTPHQGPLP